MSRKHLLAAAKVAEADHRLQQHRLRLASRPWLRRFREHRASIVLGASFVGGLLTARGASRVLMKAVSLSAGTASLLLRTPLGSFLLAGITTARASKDSTQQDSPPQ